MRVRGGQSGFSLIELMIVVAIVGLLASIAIPVFNRALEKANRTATAGELKNLYGAMSRYYADNGSYPALDTATFEPLVGDGYLDGPDPLTNKFEGGSVLRYFNLGASGWWMIVRPKGDAESLMYVGDLNITTVDGSKVLWDGVYWYNAGEGHTAIVRIDGSPQ